MEQVIITIIGILISMGCLGVIISKNPIHSIIFFVIIVLNQSILLLLLKSEFLALIYLVIYIGAISILFLFIVMMLKLKISSFTTLILKNLQWIILIILLFFIQLILVLYFSDLNLSEFLWNMEEQVFEKDPILLYMKKSNLVCIGVLLYSYYYYYLIIASIILLIAIIGAIVLTLQKHKEK